MERSYQETIYRPALEALAARDGDYAQSQNAIGFAASDSDFGHKLVEQEWPWTPRQCAAIYRLLRRYANTQLPELGFDFSTFPEPPVVDERPADAPRTPRGPKPIRTVVKAVATLDGDAVLFNWDRYDDEADARMNAVKSLPGRKWLPERKHWWVPLTAASVPALVRVLTSHTWQETPTLRKRIEQQQAAMETAVEASQAASATFTVSGLLDGERVRPFQRAGVAFAIEHKRVIVADDMGLGKQHPIDTKVLTPSGWREIGTLVPGDMVIGSDGKPTRVMGVYPQGVRENYRVAMSDGSSVEAGDEHLWTVRYRKAGRAWTELVVTTEQLRTRTVVNGVDLSKTRLSLPMLSGPVRFDAQDDLPLPGYLIGAAIANGSTRGTMRIACHREDADHVVSRLGVPIGSVRVYDNTAQISIPGVRTQTRALGLDTLSREKRIPRVIFTAAPEDRIAVLHGMMDGDGSITETRNRVTYHTTSVGLADDVVELVEGLGGIASVRRYARKDGRPDDYQVRMRLPDWVSPFTLPRKAEHYQPGSHARPSRTIKEVIYSRDAESVCIAVESADQLYITEHCILTHNTLQSLATMTTAGAKRVLIICPASLKLNWAREIAQWVGPEETVAVIEGRKLSRIPSSRWVIINSDILSAWSDYLSAVNWDGVIVDEAHQFKSGDKSQRGKALASILGYTTPPYLMLLTGTPILNRPIELWPLLRYLGKENIVGGWSHFTSHYCNAQMTGYGWDFSGASNLDELNLTLRSGGIMIRRRKADVLTELPSRLWATIPTAMTKTQSREYRAIEAGLDGGAEVAIKTIGDLRQYSAQAKIGAAIDWIDRFLETGQKLVVFTWHREISDAIADHYAAPKIVGGMRQRDVEAGKQAFQMDPQTKVIVCNIAAGGVGHTLTAASNVLFIERAWNAALMDQALDRCHRIGQTADSVTGWVMTSQLADGAETIDAYMQDMIDGKRSVTEAGVDGSRSARASLMARIRERLLAEEAEEIDDDRADRAA